mgnify:CR=1 FL=1
MAYSFDAVLQIYSDEPYVGAVERGEYNITVLTLRRFVHALGITLQDALRGTM